MSDPQLYLASQSPRRAELLKQIGVRFELLSIDVDETRHANEAADRFVQRLALEKAQAGWSANERKLQLPVLGSDTIVVLGDQIFGKPRDREACLAMLNQLSDATHQVMTAIALVQEERQFIELSTSQVRFRSLSNAECQAYWESGEPQDRAGSYAIQGIAASFIQHLEGSFSGVMGLPLYELSQLLQNFQISVLATERETIT